MHILYTYTVLIVNTKFRGRKKFLYRISTTIYKNLKKPYLVGITEQCKSNGGSIATPVLIPAIKIGQTISALVLRADRLYSITVLSLGHLKPQRTATTTAHLHKVKATKIFCKQKFFSTFGNLDFAHFRCYVPRVARNSKSIRV